MEEKGIDCGLTRMLGVQVIDEASRLVERQVQVWARAWAKGRGAVGGQWAMVAVAPSVSGWRWRPARGGQLARL